VAVNADEVQLDTVYDLRGKDLDVHVYVEARTSDGLRFIVRQLPSGPRWSTTPDKLSPRTVDLDLFGKIVGCACRQCVHHASGRTTMPDLPADAGRRDGWPS
jgi:hypothetical protein